MVDKRKDAENTSVNRAAVAASGIGGTLLGVGVGIAANDQLPIRSFEWILDKGVAGLLLVLVFVVGTLYLREKGAREREERERREEAMGLLREQVGLTQKVTSMCEQCRSTLNDFKENMKGGAS